MGLGHPAGTDDVDGLLLEEPEAFDEILVPVGIEPDPTLLVDDADIVLQLVVGQTREVSFHGSRSS